MTAAPTASALLALALLLTACGQALPERPVAHVCSQSPSQPSTDGVALADASRSFGLRLTRLLAVDTRDNVFVSPLSAQMALAMAAYGARGTTQRAMLDAMGLGGLGADPAAREAGALIDRLTASGCATVEIANGLWARRGLDLDPGYLKTVQSTFKGAARPLDTGSAKMINDWVSHATHGKISSIVDSVPRDVLIYLINAIYFRGDWQAPFDAALTRQAPFHRAGAADVTVPLMVRSGIFTYGEGSDYQALALPYRGDTVRMVVILPSAPLVPSGFAQYLEPTRFQQVVAGLQPGLSGELQLPRFSLDFKASLLEPLSALGMGPALQAGADFLGIAPSCGNHCFISDVTQKSRLEVDEKGTTAAAATRVAIAVSGRVGASFKVVVDRPFLTAIQDTATGTLLFVGVIGDPTTGR